MMQQPQKPQTQGVPAWLSRSLGKLVELNTSTRDHNRGDRGVLLSIATKSRWGDTGVYCTVAFNLRDISDESNVEIAHLAPIPRRS